MTTENTGTTEIFYSETLEKIPQEVEVGTDRFVKY
jgi:hypothetical protein